MKVEPRSLDFQKTYDKTTYYLELLNDITLGDNFGTKKEKSGELDKIEKEAEINDPAAAAFLRMTRLATLGPDRKSKKEEE